MKRCHFRKTLFLNCCPSTLNEKPAFSNTSGLKSVFVKLRFRDGLVWTVDPTISCAFKVLGRSVGGLRGGRPKGRERGKTSA